MIPSGVGSAGPGAGCLSSGVIYEYHFRRSCSRSSSSRSVKTSAQLWPTSSQAEEKSTHSLNTSSASERSSLEAAGCRVRARPRAEVRTLGLGLGLGLGSLETARLGLGMGLGLG